MTKIKNFRITLRPRDIARWLKKERGLETTPELEMVIEQGMKEAKRWIEPAAIYTTLTRQIAEKTIPISFPEKAIAVSVMAVSVGPALETERLAAQAEGARESLFAALQQEALAQALQFVVRLVQEQAKEEDCDMSSPVSGPEVHALTTLLGVQRIGISLNAADPALPSHARLAWLFWTPVGKAAAKRGEKSLPKARLLSFLATTYIRFVGLTSRTVWVNRVIREEQEASGKGFIYAFWHGRQAYLTYLHRNTPVHPLISHSQDGELIARVCRSFGMEPVRGSSSKGGTEAVLQMRTLMDKGDAVAFTPDGPRGPLHRVQPGALFVAQKTGRPIVPVAVGVKRRWIFKGSWDEFIVPKPFNRVAMVYGEPIYVKPDDDLQAKAAELEQALNAVSEEADGVAGVGCCS